MLREAAWANRQRHLTLFALAQSVGLGLIALVITRNLSDAALAVLVPGLPAAMGALGSLSRRQRTLSTVTSLMFASATLVDLTGGLTEAHFHFFVMLGVVSLYQDWSAFGLCVLIIVLHHAVMGIGAPSSVFASPEQQRHPVRWAVVHAGFILAASVTHMIAWKLNEQQELRDPLTQLPNRRNFNGELEAAALARTAVAVMFIDIDNFKTINDSGGHHVGDAALAYVSAVVRRAIRTHDVVARVGGDEFAVLLRADAETALIVARRVQSGLMTPTVVGGRAVRVSASIGVVDDVLAVTRDPQALLRAADSAMYLAKSAGGGQTVLYSADIHRVAEHRARLTRDLAVALEQGQLHLNYQPIVDIASGEVEGVEALLRWTHPELGPVSPAEFIPLAEDTGDILAVGRWVLAQSCRAVASLPPIAPQGRDLRLSVNLAAQQLRDPALLDDIATALAESGLEPSRLTLEVTETSMLQDLDLARRQLEAVRALGITIAIDDFGTGYSSLSYLARLPADKVKIDRSFISGLHSEVHAATLVRCILDMSRALGLDVVAEGVEDRAQQQLLVELGCTSAQGYLFAAPMTFDDMSWFVANRVGTAAASPRAVSAIA